MAFKLNYIEAAVVPYLIKVVPGLGGRKMPQNKINRKKNNNFKLGPLLKISK